MDVCITPAPLSGSIRAIPSKSAAHRLMIAAALARGETRLFLPHVSNDILTTENCLRALGAAMRREDEILSVRPIRRDAQGLPFPLLDCGESGSTLRFLLPVSAALYNGVNFTGSGRLPERSIGHLAAEMARHGIAFSDDRLPFSTMGQLCSGAYMLPGNVSSQYVTGLLLALPLLKGDSTLTLTTGLESAAYVEITLRVLETFSIKVERQRDTFYIPGDQAYISPGDCTVEGDWSNAAFYLVAGALSGPVTVTGLQRDSAQGDGKILPLLAAFGANAGWDAPLYGPTVSPGDLRGQTIDVSNIPDLLPILAVVAACAEGETRFVGGARLRDKESDRLLTTAKMLHALGGSATELPEGLIVRGGPLAGGVVHSCRDHRIAMAAAIAAIRSTGPVTILDADAVDKSYPTFFETYSALGGNVHVL